MGDYVELDRTFYELQSDFAGDAASDDLDIKEALGLRVGAELGWPKIREYYRIVILAEAGSGKTEEIRNETQKLRGEGKSAFFLRLEHIADNFDGAFEEGDLVEFYRWLESGDEGWLLLDSVDESRLRHPSDFERAIIKLSSHLQSALQRVHIVITGRVDAWRPKTDLVLCNDKLGYRDPVQIVRDLGIDVEASKGSVGEFKEQTHTTEGEARTSGFKVFSISDLSSDQIEKFARAKGVKDVAGFMREIEIRDAWSYTNRPQDIIEVVDFWIKEKRIGSHFELIRNCINRRLEERSESRASAKPISKDQVRRGARLVAAASILMRQPVIRIPDGSDNNLGIDSTALLAEWSNEECKILLTRPIFVDGIYGSVRFHTRRVKEYLAAEWFHDLLNRGVPRRDIESIFYRKIYGAKVLIPSMRPVLVWLLLLDIKIMEKACKIEPEIIFEGGDPSRLPLKIRWSMLEELCKKIDSGVYQRSAIDYSSAQRFANPDMSSHIRTLVKRYHGNSTITSFLMRMIFHGRIKALLADAKEYACSEHAELYTRIAAIKAVQEIGGAVDFDDVLEGMRNQETRLDRRLVAETVDLLELTSSSINWIFDVLPSVEKKEKFSTKGLGTSLAQFAEKLDGKESQIFIENVKKFLDREPFIEKRHCKISEEYGWLITCGVSAIDKLIDTRNPYALSSACVSVISRVPFFKEYREFGNSKLLERLVDQINAWPDLNYALFWKDVEITRENHFYKKGERLTEFWQAFSLRSFWRFSVEDFDVLKEYVRKKEFLDDKLVALTLAFQIYKENGRPQEWREQLKVLVKGDSDLEGKLSELLSPPPLSAEQKKYRRQERAWKMQDRLRKKQQEKYHSDWKAWLHENSQKLNDSELLRETIERGSCLNAQHYLIDRMRELKDNSSTWAGGNWMDLIPAYGEEVSKAFRDGLVRGWRIYRPLLRSEGADEKSTLFTVILGLSGLEIDSRETAHWVDSLSNEEVELACRYAFQELNGFPSWFFKIREKHCAIVDRLLLDEMAWELSVSQEGLDRHYIIDKISWSDQAIWNDLAPQLLSVLASNFHSAKYLGSLLKIVQGSSSVTDEEIARLASERCKVVNDLNHLAYWFAVWIGVEPAKAIKALRKRLKNITEGRDALNFAMNVIVNLVGDRSSGSNSRHTFKSPEYLVELYLLMQDYIKIEDDIDRAGKGAYSPGLRDDAQEARNSLVSMLRDIPGKEAYKQIVKIAKKHPEKAYRPWMMRSAKERAELDSEFKAWKYEQIKDLEKSVNNIKVQPMTSKEKIWGAFAGALFICLLLALVVFIPNPSGIQADFFRIVLALSAAAVGGVFTGFIHVEGKMAQFSIRAGGALALFFIVYFINPAISV